MQILKYILVMALVVFQFQFVQAGRSASYHQAAKYFKANPKKVVKKSVIQASKYAKSTKLKKSAKNKRSIASVSPAMKLKLKKTKSAKLPGKKKFLR